MIRIAAGYTSAWSGAGGLPRTFRSSIKSTRALAEKVMRRSRHALKALLAVLAVPSIATAALKDTGPLEPATGFPRWYRDTSGAALSLCLDQRPSPNAEAGGAPMCFPVVTDPAGYPGNLGSENFYFNASTSLSGANGFSLLWEGAIEATYGNGTPVRGDEITFARIRVVMNTQAAGTYKVIHPYGVEVFPDVQPGNRSVFFTVDIGIAPGSFTGALAGAVGPFLEWEKDAANPAAPWGFDTVSGLPYSLELLNDDGSTTQFLGDPNFFHAVQGSPFLTNFVRVEGPPGSNLDGLGNDSLVTNQFALVGQRYTIPIPVPLNVYRANLSVHGGISAVDVFAESIPAARLIASAPGVPTHELSVDPVSGEAYGHVEFQAQSPIGSEVTVTNVADSPHSKHVAQLTDLVSTGPAVLLPDASGATGGTLSITAETSVHTSPAPLLAIVELPGATWTVRDPLAPWIQTFEATLPAGATPPWHLTAVSEAGGSHAEPVIVGTIGVLAPIGPIAMPLALSTTQGLPVTSASVADPSSPGATIMVLNPPASGAATVNADGTLTYAPGNLFNGVDSFTYVLHAPDPVSGRPVYSNVGVVSVDVAAVNLPPTAVTNLVTTPAGTPVTIDVAANDTDIDGTVVPGSVAIASQPFAGTVVNNGNGTVTYTPAPGVTGAITFTYTIQDNLGGVSAPGTVQVTVLAQAEVVNITRAEWVVSKGRWKITGTSSVFGPGVANTVTVRIGVSPNLGATVGTSPIDATGGWAIDVTNAVVLDGTGRVTALSTGGGSRSAVVTRK